MKKIHSLLIMLLCCMAAGAQTSLNVTKDKAYEFARNLVSDDSGEYDYYIGETQLPISVNGSPISRQVPAYFVLVDEEPGSSWEHPCKYVYVPKESKYIYYYRTVDTVCPPANMRLEPIYVPNRYGANAAKKPAVEKDLSNAPNEAAGNTYAVILNGGMSTVSNKEHYWNDCSFFYQTLRNRYDIPKSNIKVIMSDGTDGGEDLNLISGGYASSPLDLDGDGQPDIEYAATKENLQQVLSELAQKLTDNDHLLLFVTDHGGIDKTRNNKTYMYLWNNVKLYPEELAAYLEPINAGFVSIVMGQCYSGGFIEALKDTNRIIATASSATEMSFRSTTVPFNEFLYHWTSALNGCDAFGNEVDSGEALPITDAQLYAAKHDFYANNGTKRAKETPQISYFTHSVASDLSLSCIPPTVDIVFDKYKEPLVSELVTRQYDNRSTVDTFGHLRPYNPDFNGLARIDPPLFWQSPYIWVRNTRDGVAKQDIQRLKVDPDCDEKFVAMYTKVRNRGVRPYNQKNQNVATYWTPANLTITVDEWKGAMSSNTVGGRFGLQTITKAIQPGMCEILEFRHTFYNGELDALKAADGNLCYLAFVTYENLYGEIPVDSNRIAEVWNTDKLAQCNVSFVRMCDSMFVKVGNFCEYPLTAELKLVEDSSNVDIFRNANVSFCMTQGLSDSWKNGGRVGTDIEENKNAKGIFYLRDIGSKFDNIILQPRQKERIGLKANFFANTSITERQQYDINMSIVNKATGQCLGGETFRIVQEPRPAINPLVNATVQDNGKTLLEATNVDEEVAYKWYDADGNVVGTGATFEVPAGAASSYTVRAEAVSDGAISDSAPVQAETTTIKSVDAQSSTDAVDVRFYEAVPGGARLCLTSSDGITPASYYNVENGATAYSIPATDLPSGIYQVTMIQNGTVTGVKKFVK